MADRKVPSNCGAGNTVNARCVQVDFDAPDYNIEKGDNMDYALQQITESTISSTPNSSVGDFNANLYCLGGSGNSICASQIVTRNLEYSLTPDSAGNVLFSWDLTGIRSTLPAGFSTTFVSVVANNSSSNLAILNSSSISASNSFRVSDYPVTINIRMRIETSCGQIELVKDIYLYNTADSGDKVAIMNLNDYTADNIQNIGWNDFAELVASEICQVKDRVTLLEQNDYLSRISALENEVAALKETLNADQS